jgi:uncharacterized membrane protein
MTDEKTTNETSQEPVTIAAAAVGDDAGIIAEGAVAIQGSAAILVARFADQSAAGVAYEALREAEAERALKIDGVLVVDSDRDGRMHVRKLTDHHTRRGTTWGAVAGGALAIIFPPSLLAGIVAGGIVGAVIGKVGNISTKDKVAAELGDVITPGTSGIVALIDITALDEVKATIPDAEEVKAVEVDAATADAVKDAAKAAEGDASA